MESNYDIIYCPFYEANVSVWSEMIDKIGEFPMFILASFNDFNSNVEDIMKATNLNPSVVLETINELIENGLLKNKNDSQYFLTDLGEQYIRINTYLDNFSKNVMVAVNAFTGSIETISNKEYFNNENIPNNENVLLPKINRLLLKNHNFSNIKEYMKNIIDISSLNISDNDYDYIIFDLKPTKKTFFVPYLVTEDTILHKSNDNDHLIELVIPIEKIKREITHVEYERYKNIINQLLDVSNTNESLLSQYGNYIMGIIKKVNEQNKKEPIYIECYSGTKIEYEPSSYENTYNNIQKFSLSKHKKMKDETIIKDDFIISKKSIQMEFKQHVSFYDLTQME